jgi:FkbM family methyltransferase
MPFKASPFRGAVLVRESLRAFYRGHAQFYPWLFNIQQRFLPVLEPGRAPDWEARFGALPLLGLPAEAQCIDIGGKRGEAVAAIKQAVPQARIVSFEPNPVTYPVLRRVAARHRHVVTCNFGIGAGEEQAVMYIPVCCGVVFDQLARTALPDRAETADELNAYGFPFATADNVTFDIERIRFHRLDRFALAPDLIRIEVKGEELAILRGAHTTISRLRPALIVGHGDRPEIVAFLEQRGYLRCVYDDGGLSFARRRADLNAVFVHETRIPTVMWAGVRH